MAADKNAGRLSQLRRYAHLPSDVDLIKEMIADGLSNEQIAHALGHSDDFSRDHLPDSHSFGDSLPTDQEDQEAMTAKEEQSSAPSQTKEEKEDSDPLVHVMGLLNHIVKKKANNKP